MNRQRWILFIFLIPVLLFVLSNIYGRYNRNIVNAIKNKIRAYLISNYNIKLASSDINVESYNLPEYRLYEISIAGIKESARQIEFKIKVRDFFNKDDYTIVNATAKYQKREIMPDVTERVKVIYRKKPVEIITYGKVLKRENGSVLIMTDFGKKIKCRIIDKERVEVIE